MSFSISDIEPTNFIGNTLAEFYNRSPLATKITLLARSILFGVFFAAVTCWQFPVPLATVLPWAYGMTAMVMLFQAIAYGNAFINHRLKE